MRLDRRWKVLACAALTAAAVGCSSKTPKGQVLAIVNGQDVTVQDLAAEARARKLPGGINQPALLQEVVARVLLAQNAHARKLDTYAGYPADINRLRQTFLADKLLAAEIKPTPSPTDAEVKSFVDAHPNAFAQRQRFQVEALRYQPGSAAAAIGDPSSMAAAVSKLKSLNITYDQNKQVLDSLVIPADLTRHLAETPNGQYIQFKEGPVTIAVVIDARQPVVAPPEQQMVFAREALVKNAASRQARSLVDKLRLQAKVNYQPGMAPPAPGAAPGVVASTNAKAK